MRDSDTRAVLEFIEFAWAHAGERPFPLETLERLAQLVPCDAAGYSEMDQVNRRVLAYVGTDGSDGGEDMYWQIADEHPLCRYELANGDWSARRLSDVIAFSRLVHTRVYAEWFRPVGVVAELGFGIARSRRQTRNFVLSRTSGDFTDRDVAVAQRIAPQLARIYEMTQLRRVAVTDDPSDLDRLTTRESEILDLVAAGLTNAGIAERLWISPGTVKKHLDNVYSKLGVANRTAAAARIAQPKAQPE